MSFIGTSMIFDGIACEEMGLVLYDFDSAEQDVSKFASDLEVAEDRIEGRYRSLFYGGSVNTPLTFKMVMCASEERVARNEPFDRWDMQKIASWLTGHVGYRWLSIVQPDLEQVRYRCIISELEAVEVANNKWGFTCKVTCDSPFAYMTPQPTIYQVEDKLDAELFSESTYNGFYYPRIQITGHSGGDISIAIQNDIESYAFQMKGLPSAMGDINIDGENGVMFTSSGLNPYQYVQYTSGFHFPRLARGTNHITLSGAGTYTFTCEWPVNVGG